MPSRSFRLHHRQLPTTYASPWTFPAIVRWSKVGLHDREREPAEAYVSRWSSDSVKPGAYHGLGEVHHLEPEACARSLAVPEICSDANQSGQEKLNPGSLSREVADLLAIVCLTPPVSLPLGVLDQDHTHPDAVPHGNQSTRRACAAALWTMQRACASRARLS